MTLVLSDANNKGPMFDPQYLAFTQMIHLSSVLRKFDQGAGSMEDVANRIVHYFHDHLVSQQTNRKACLLVRLFKTHSFGELDPGLRKFATTLLGDAAASPAMKCLVLLATAGEKPEWNSRTESTGHKAIPLPSEQAIDKIPMISHLLSQLGLSSGALLSPDPALLLEMQQTNFNVFHVPEAEGSPYVPAQKEFVIPHGVRSVLGYGGLLPNGDLFAVILFLRVYIPRETADLFKTLAMSTRLALVPFAGHKVFAQ